MLQTHLEEFSGIIQVGEGVKGLAHGDWVVPAVTHLGSWRTLAVWKEADLLKLPKGTLPIEHAAVFRELCLAYRLLEDHGNLKVYLTAHPFLYASDSARCSFTFVLTQLLPCLSETICLIMVNSAVACLEAQLHALNGQWQQ